ncbi:unnamed protein product (macronuclear) [Paramecium tetraurelia]|uniref:Uncharacterized protein n=1 Tax=Paramecium tetraurelia TaxID=5888 RepID=A0E622_PARTE|nr:uncharacterized protein GSPATT00003602001 [Paramecium tetraurelia]CAK90739.1 unnamed protein product [Paramecium tetraurelia]|eukprot:XP_001458136.1 hypothetical protein (macronuclear) [Paramecium tetraurelia strain d4-2]
MNDSLRSLSTNDSLEGQTRKKKKSNATSKKTNRPQNISYTEVVDLLNPSNLFINKNLEEEFNAIELYGYLYYNRIPETSYFPHFKFILDENLTCTETKWRRLPTFVKLTS